MISAQNAVSVSFNHESWKIGHSYIYDSEGSALLKMNCQITPRTTPPMRFGTKKKVLKMFALRNFVVTISARPNATTLMRTSDTTTKRPVN